MKRIIVVLAFLMVIVRIDASSAGDELRLRGIGPEISFVSTHVETYGLATLYDLDSAIGIGACADLGVLSERLVLEAGVRYWSTSDEAVVIGTPIEASASLFTLEGVVKYVFPVDSDRFAPFAGGGLNFNRGSVTVSGGGESTGDSDSKIGLALTGGTSYELNDKWDLVGELRYVVISDYDHWSLAFGARYLFDR